MMWYKYGYCTQCRELVGLSETEHAEESHDCEHVSLPRISDIRGGQYVAEYDYACITGCDFGYLNGHHMCVDCGAVKVPRPVANPTDHQL